MNKSFKIIFILYICIFAVLLNACSGNTATVITSSSEMIPSSPSPASSSFDASSQAVSKAPQYAREVVQTLSHIPLSDGLSVLGNENVTIDVSHTGNGYIMVLYTGNSSGKIKFRITGPDNRLYTYNLQDKTGYQTFPLTGGSGTYTVQTFEQASGTDYYLVQSDTFSAAIEDDFLPYLYPNQFVNFSESSDAVSIARTLAKEVNTDLEYVEKVYNYTMQTITYDDYKAANVQSGYIPDIDSTIQTGTGICFDYACLMAAMLRSQNIPTKLVIGWSGDIYHAWISVYVTDIGWVNNIIQFDGSGWKLMDPTFADNANQEDWIMQYIANTNNYQEVYVY